jgi:hypothetical protein
MVVEEAVRWYAAHPAPADGGGVWVDGVQDGHTPLHRAAWGHTATVEALLRAGAEVNVQNKVCTFLHPPLTLSPCLPRVWVCVAKGRRRPSGGTRLTRHPLTGVVCVGCRMGGLRFIWRRTAGTRRRWRCC